MLGAEMRFFDAGDYPLVETPELIHELVGLYREVQPAVVLTHARADPYNHGPRDGAHDRHAGARLAQAPGVGRRARSSAPRRCSASSRTSPSSAASCPNVLLDITPGWERKREAMQVLGCAVRTWSRTTPSWAGAAAPRRPATPALTSGCRTEVCAEAYQRVFPQVTQELA